MSRSNPRNKHAQRFLWSLLATAAVAAAGKLCADEAEMLNSFLGRLGLVDLQILHLEKTLDLTGTRLQRVELAKRLADLYAERLMTTVDDYAGRDKVRDKVRQLLAMVPEANTPALQVMLLQAEYSRAEQLFNQWADDPREVAALQEAKSNLQRIAPSLHAYQQDLTEELEKVRSEIDRLQDTDQLAVKEQEARRLDGFASRAAFFSGWSNYYYGVTKQNLQAAESDFRTAVTAFCKILGIGPDEDYRQIEIEWLGLENIHRANSLIGLGLAELALGNLESGRTCFQFLEHVSVPPTLRDQATYWFLRGLLNAGQLAEATQYAHEQVSKFFGNVTQGKVTFCVTLVRAGFARIHGDEAPRSVQLGQLGVQGLARLGQFPIVHQLIAKYEIQLPEEGGGFYVTWIRGQQQFDQAEESENLQQYQAAADTLGKALKDPQTAKDVPSAAQCQYALAWCLFRLTQYEKAAQHFQQAAAAMKQSGLSKAADAAWLTFSAYYELAKGDKRFVASAIDSLRTFKRDFPNSEQAKQADYFLSKLQQTTHSPEQSIQALSQVKPTEPNYLAARAEICLLHQQLWSQVRDDSSRAEAAAADVYRSVDQLLTAARRDADNQRKLKCTLLAVDVALRSTNPDVSKAQSYLGLAKPWADSLPVSNSFVAEYHYQQFQVAQATDNRQATYQHAAWLVQNARGSLYERSAIVTIAKAADEAVQSASPDQLRQRQVEAAEVYGRLVELLGSSQEVIATNRNARIANIRLANYASEIGRHAEAAARWETIVAAYSKNRDYLRQAGLAQYRVGNYSASLEHWRTLLAGLPANSEAWYEAKYFQVACLSRIDKDAAAQVFRQFQLLHPTVPVDAWREKFNALESEISGA